jgi:hypothetical protein
VYTRICIIVAFNIAVGNGGIGRILLWNCEGVRASRPPFSLPSLHLRRLAHVETEAACEREKLITFKDLKSYFFFRGAQGLGSVAHCCVGLCVWREGSLEGNPFSTFKRRCYDNGREACRESRVGMATIFCILIAK